VASRYFWSCCVSPPCWGILFYFFDLEKGPSDGLVKNSRVMLLLDTSQSMAIRDYDTASQSLGASRSEVLAQSLREHRLLEQLNERHDVTAQRFSDSAIPEKMVSSDSTRHAIGCGRSIPQAAEQVEARLAESRRIAAIAGALLLLAILCGVFYSLGSYWRGFRPPRASRDLGASWRAWS
jgi:hypothetical protein